MNIEVSLVELLTKVGKFINPKKLKNAVSLNKKSNQLYKELKLLVFDIHRFFERDYAVSITHVLNEFSRIEREQKAPNKVPSQHTERYTQLFKRVSIISSWFYSFLSESRVDSRKANHSWLIHRINSLNSLFGDLAEVVRDFNLLIKENPGLPDSIQSDYCRARDTYNFFLTKYEDFLKKCMREVGGTWDRSFERLS